MVLDQLTIAQIEGLDEAEIDPKELSSVVDRLQVKFCKVVNRAKDRGDHLVMGNISAVGWVANTCAMSRNSPPTDSASASKSSRCPRLPRRSAQARSVTSLQR